VLETTGIASWLMHAEAMEGVAPCIQEIPASAQTAAIRTSGRSRDALFTSPWEHINHSSAKPPFEVGGANWRHKPLVRLR